MVKGKRPQTRHLIPAKKGEIRNKKGMTPGTITMPKLLKAIVQAVNGNIKVKDQFTGRLCKREVVGMLAAQLIADSLSEFNSANERTQANRLIQDRVLGKPKETTVLQDPGGNALQPPTISVNFTDGVAEPLNG